jgi:hypothetical protein
MRIPEHVVQLLEGVLPQACFTGFLETRPPFLRSGITHHEAVRGDKTYFPERVTGARRVNSPAAFCGAAARGAKDKVN